MSCAKTAEPIEIPFEVLTLEGPRSMFHMGPGVHIDATWQIRLNMPCAAVMLRHVKLL